MATKKYVSLEKLSLYDEKIKKYLADADAAVLAEAKKHTDDAGALYDVAGAAATVQENLDKEVTRAKAREDEIAGLVSATQGEVDALETVVAGKADQSKLDELKDKVGAVPEGSTVMGIIGEIQESAYDDTQLRADMNTELAKKADKTQVTEDIAAAVKVETDARVEAVAGVQSQVDAIKDDYLKGTDKIELTNAIALKADQSALDEVSAVANAAVKQADYDVKVKALEDEDARIAGLVAAEVERASGVEESLQTQINTIMNNPDTEGVINSINEFTQYIEEHGEIAEGFRTDIDANAKAIEDHAKIDHDFAGADAALKTELEGKIDGKANTVHSHDDLYYTEAEVDALIEGVAHNEVFTVIATKGEDGKYSTDKTYDEIYDAYINKKEIYVRYDDGTYDGIYQFNCYDGDSVVPGFAFEYHSVNNTRIFRRKFIITPNGVAFNEAEFSQNRIATVNTNSTLTTTDKTLVGAINEINEEIASHNHDDVYYTEAEIDSKIEEVNTAIEGAKTDASNKDAVVLAEAQKGIDAVQLALDTHTGNGDVHVTTTDKAKWNAALQSSDIAVGSANGTISVKGEDVAVKGLGSAAYKADTAFDAAGSAAQALIDAKAHTDAAIAQFVECSEEEINALFA